MNRRDRLLRQVHLQRIVVTLTSGETFDGLLADADDNSVRLVDVFAVDEKSRVSVDGEMYLPRANVSYMQNPGGKP